MFVEVFGNDKTIVKFGESLQNMPSKGLYNIDMIARISTYSITFTDGVYYEIFFKDKDKQWFNNLESEARYYIKEKDFKRIMENK